MTATVAAEASYFLQPRGPTPGKPRFPQRAPPPLIHTLLDVNRGWDAHMSRSESYPEGVGFCSGRCRKFGGCVRRESFNRTALRVNEKERDGGVSVSALVSGGQGF